MQLRSFQSISIPAAGATFEGVIAPAMQQEGREVILAFHGYGRPLEDFALFLPLLKPHQELVSLGLFGHGTSRLPEATYPFMRPIAVADFKAWMEALLDALDAPQVHLLTYSMGGRIALKTAELLPHRVGKMRLMAPDGFRQPWMYNPLYGTAVGRWFYQTTVEHPGWIFGLTRLFTKLGLVHPKTEKFVEVHFGTREKRIMLRDVWSRYRSINPDLKRIAHLINQEGLDVQLVFGTRDSVIPVKLGTRFQKQVDRPILRTIDQGHQLLTPQLLQLFEREQLWF